MTADSEAITTFCRDLEYHLRQYGVVTTAHYEPPVREFFAATFRAHAAQERAYIVEYLLTHRAAWFSQAPHHHVIVGAEPDGAMITIAAAVRALDAGGGE